LCRRCAVTPRFTLAMMVPPVESRSASQHALDQGRVGRIQNPRPAQLAFALGGHLGQDMALERPLVLVSRSGLLEPLGGSAMDLHLWHWLPPGRVVIKPPVSLPNG